MMTKVSSSTHLPPRELTLPLTSPYGPNPHPRPYLLLNPKPTRFRTLRKVRRYTAPVPSSTYIFVLRPHVDLNVWQDTNNEMIYKQPTLLQHMKQGPPNNPLHTSTPRYHRIITHSSWTSFGRTTGTIVLGVNTSLWSLMCYIYSCNISSLHLFGLSDAHIFQFSPLD